MPRKSVRTKTSRLRIISGQWRGRLIEFDDHAGLRPTGDRIRETLFNWLQSKTPGSRCLDLYAGSGALGIEAVSRGAKSATLIDNSPQVVARLKAETEKLGATAVHVVQANARDFLLGAGQENRGHPDDRYDIVFIDPPFDDESQLDSLRLCVDTGILNKQAWLYVEARDAAQLEGRIPTEFATLKSRRTGNIQYLLLEYQ